MSSSATILIAYTFDRRRMRHTMLQDPFQGYASSMTKILTLVLSLRHVGTRLPVHLLVGGERHSAYESVLRRHGVRILDGARYRLRVPRWAVQCAPAEV